MNENFLRELGDILQAEANIKIKEGMQLFIRADDVLKRVFLHATGFTGNLTATELREHFDTLELMDTIDEHIWNFKENMGLLEEG